MGEPKTNKQLQREFTERQRKRGMVRFQKWVTQEQAEAIEKLLREYIDHQRKRGLERIQK